MRKRAAGLAEEMQKLDDTGKKSERELDSLKDKIHETRKQANAEADKKANLNATMQSLQKQVYAKQEEVDVKKELINKERAVTKPLLAYKYAQY
jgi:predicted  nucleic acid-binding Zn-ribbon protein